jgi:hypothetical protein
MEDMQLAMEARWRNNSWESSMLAYLAVRVSRHCIISLLRTLHQVAQACQQ